MSTVHAYLVDTSGSMDGSRKDQLCRQVENQRIDYLFAFGDDIRGQYKCSELRNLPFNTGTRIQHCLFQMFELLKTINGDKKYFVLITDAEDSITDVDGLKRVWEKCREEHKQKGGFLAGSAMFIGRGPAAKDIEAVFGHIDKVTDGELDGVLKDIEKRIDDATKYDQELGTVSANIKQLDMKNSQAESTLREAEEAINTLQKNVESAQQGTEAIKTEVSSLRDEIRELNAICVLKEKDKLNKKLNEANALSKQLEVKQNELLSKCDVVLGHIELQKIELEKKKSEISAQGSKVDDATTTAKNGLAEIEELQKKLKDMNSKLKDADNNFLENVLEQIIGLSKDVRDQATKQKKGLMNVVAVQRKLLQVKKGLTECQLSLDESKRIANEEIDNLVQILS